MNLAFLGTGQFAAQVLHQLAKIYLPVLVITQPPKPAGKKLKLTVSPVESASHHLNLTVAYDFNELLIQHSHLDAIIVCDYGVMLPTTLFSQAPLGVLNLHPSLLPRWRGAAPIERAILAGDAETGVCLMQVVERLDAGDVLMQSPPLSISPNHNREKLLMILADTGSQLLIDYLACPEGYPPIAQNEQYATYAKKMTVKDKQLDFTKDAFLVARQVQAFAPKPGAFCLIEGERIKILQATPLNYSHSKAPGTLLQAEQDKLLIACNQNALSIQRLQRASKNAMATQQFLLGFNLQHKVGQCIVDDFH